MSSAYLNIAHPFLVLPLSLALSSGGLSAENDDMGWLIEEVVVTAQKREQSVNDIGVAVAAFSAEEMNALRIETPNDVAALVPSLDIKNTIGGVNPAITLRGVGLNDFNANNNPSVGVYVDELFLASPGMLSMSTFDVARVEVLKGPQGTLYGRNTNGGAINFVTNKASQENEAYVTVGYGNYELMELEGAIGGGLTKELSGRFSLMHTNQGETTTVNKTAGDDFGDSESTSVRSQFLYEKEDFTGSFSWTYGKQDVAFTGWQGVGYLDSATATTRCASALGGNPSSADCVSVAFETITDEDPDVTRYGAGQLTGDSEAESHLLNLNLVWDFDDFTLTSVTGYADVKRGYIDNVQPSPQFGIDYFSGQHNETIEQFSQEVRFNGDYQKTTWVAGLFYATDDVDSSTLFGGEDLFLTQWDVNYQQETEALALFLHTETVLNDEWTLIAGIRYSEEEREYKGGTTDLNTGNDSLLLYLPLASGGFGFDACGSALPLELCGPLDLTSSTKYDLDDDSVSGKLGLDYRPNDNWLIYGSVSTGFKSGIVFGDITFSPTEEGPLDPEEITAYEVGFKATLAGSTMQLNGAIFHYDYEDMQVRVPGSLALTFTNAEESTVDGAELDLNWRPLRGLDIRFGIGYVDTEVKKTGSNPGALIFTDDALDGNELANAPELQYTGVLRYEFSVTNGLTLAMQTDFKYSDESFKEATNDVLSETDDYTVFNARLSLLEESGKWELSLWGKNITDERYVQHIFAVDTLGIQSKLYNPPPTYGISFNYKVF